MWRCPSQTRGPSIVEYWLARYHEVEYHADLELVATWAGVVEHFIVLISVHVLDLNFIVDLCHVSGVFRNWYCFIIIIKVELAIRMIFCNLNKLINCEEIALKLLSLHILVDMC